MATSPINWAPTPASSSSRPERRVRSAPARLTFLLNPHRARTPPAVSFFEGFQTPAGPQKTRAHSCGRHLKPITKAAMTLENSLARTIPGTGKNQGERHKAFRPRLEIRNRPHPKAPSHVSARTVAGVEPIGNKGTSFADEKDNVSGAAQRRPRCWTRLSAFAYFRFFSGCSLRNSSRAALVRW